MQVRIFCATCKKPFLNPANLIKHLESQGLYCLVESINSPELSPLNSSVQSMPKEDSKEDPKEYSKEDPKEGLKEDPKDPSIKSVLLRNLYFPKQYCVRFTYICDYFGNGNYFCYINYLEWLYNIKKT